MKNFQNKVTDFVGLPQFQIPKNVLDLVFLQCLGWLVHINGSFFVLFIVRVHSSELSNCVHT